MKKLLILLVLLQILDVAVTLAVGTQYEINPFARMLFSHQHGILYLIAIKMFAIVSYIVADYITYKIMFARQLLAAVLVVAVAFYSILFVWNIYNWWQIIGG